MGALVFEPSTEGVLAHADVELLELAQDIQAIMTDGSTEVLRQLAALGAARARRAAQGAGQLRSAHGPHLDR